MRKIFKSESDLKAAITETFRFHENAKVIHSTNDGQCFLEDNKSAAEMHARKNSLKVTTVNREDYVTEDKKDTSGVSGIESMTVAALKEELTKLEIPFEDKAKKADLLALLTEAKEKG